MPPERTIPKGKRPPFNPPRPRNAPTKSTSSTPASKPKTTARRATDSNLGKRKSTTKSTSARTSHSSPGSPEAPEAASSSSSRSSQEPDYILAEIIESGPSGGGREEIDSADPMIPSKLLTRILHHHFQDEKTKIAKDANRVVAKYVDIFVREALARAAFERTEGQKESVGDDIRGRLKAKVDSFLEVEDLEKLAPQLTLDF